jgi:hypothetical protein
MAERKRRENQEDMADPFRGRPIRRIITAPGRTANTVITKATRGPALFEKERARNPEKFLTEAELRSGREPGPLSFMFGNPRRRRKGRNGDSESR